MLGKTHLAVGVAASLAVVHPATLPELLIGVGAAAVGAVISDIDVGTTDSHRDADIITAMAVASIVLVVGLDKLFDIGVYQTITKNGGLTKVLFAALAFIGVCAFGKEQPHRSFMHSFMALVILTVIVGVLLPTAAPYFGVAFLSHLVTDLFNYKKVRLLYPMPGGVCFKLFHATGIANHVLFIAGCIAAGVEVVFNLSGVMGR